MSNNHFFKTFGSSTNLKNWFQILIVSLAFLNIVGCTTDVNLSGQPSRNLTVSLNETKSVKPVGREVGVSKRGVVSLGEGSTSTLHPQYMKVHITQARPSLEEHALIFPNESISKPVSSNVVPSCDNAIEDSKIIADSLLRTFQFYETHIDAFTEFESAVGLQVLQGVLKHSHHGFGNYSKSKLLHKIAPLVNRIYEQSIKASKNDEEKRMKKVFQNANQLWKRLFENWNPLSDLNNQTANFSTIGKEKDKFLTENNNICQSTVVENCGVSDVCRKVFLEAGPQSQYMLTHQALYILLAKYMNCTNTHSDVFGNWEVNLQLYCAKMFLETEFIAKHNFPFWGRDLFSEQIAICGLAGYPNFFRQDWIRQIISWQSTSSSGCFLNVPPKNINYAIVDGSIPRRITAAEKLNITPANQTEICLPHFTSVSLSALALKWGWLVDTCSI